MSGYKSEFMSIFEREWTCVLLVTKYVSVCMYVSISVCDNVCVRQWGADSVLLCKYVCLK